jgi:hypothetical protein
VKSGFRRWLGAAPIAVFAVLASGCRLPELTPTASSHVCAEGACAGPCDPGWADCDGDLAANGCEADLASASSCGACGVRCAEGQACARGACVAASATTDGGGAGLEAGDAALAPRVLGSSLDECALQ